MKKQNIIIFHVLFWVYYFFQNMVSFDIDTQSFSIPFLSFDFSNPSVAITYSFTLLYVFTFWLNYYYVLPKYFDVNNLKRMLLALCSLFILFIGVRYLVEEVLYLQFLGFRNYHEKTTVWFYIYDNLYYGSRPIISSSVLWFIINMLGMQKKQIELVESKRETEINFLKSQINPHFIFNTLNNIYYLVFEKSDKSLQAIEQLSGLMRYMTYESQNQTIAIQREVEYIKDFIALESMRISGKANVIFDTDISNSELRIPPLLLIPFVENGFKHGVLNDANFPFRISLIQREKELILSSENAIHRNKKDAQSGIGMQNLKKRLELYYPDNHTLDIAVNGDRYVVQLKIKL